MGKNPDKDDHNALKENKSRMGLNFKFCAHDVITQGRTSKTDVDLIKEWNKTTVEKSIPVLPDELVTIFLLSCSNNIDETKKTIENYYKVKQLAPVIFDDRNVDSEEFKLVVNTTAFSTVYWQQTNTYVIYCKLLDTNYRNCFMESQLKVAVMTMDSTYYENPPDNLIIVQDMTGMGLMHLSRVKLDSLKKFFSYIQEGLPLKLKEVHYINSSYVLSKFMVIARMFIKPELYNKIHFHCGFDDLEKFIPKQYIPNDYNGESISVKELQNDSVQKLKDMKKFWEAEEEMRKQCFKTDT